MTWKGQRWGRIPRPSRRGSHQVASRASAILPEFGESAIIADHALMHVPTSPRWSKTVSHKALREEQGREREEAPTGTGRMPHAAGLCAVARPPRLEMHASCASGSAPEQGRPAGRAGAPLAAFPRPAPSPAPSDPKARQRASPARPGRPRI